jgi:hypothetical protein
VSQSLAENSQDDTILSSSAAYTISETSCISNAGGSMPLNP